MECTATSAVTPIKFLPSIDKVNMEVFEPSKLDSSIAKSSTFSYDKGPPLVNMEGTSKELAHQLEAYAQMQVQQQEDIP